MGDFVVQLESVSSRSVIYLFSSAFLWAIFVGFSKIINNFDSDQKGQVACGQSWVFMEKIRVLGVGGQSIIF